MKMLLVAALILFIRSLLFGQLLVVKEAGWVSLAQLRISKVRPMAETETIDSIEVRRTMYTVPTTGRMSDLIVLPLLDRREGQILYRDLRLDLRVVTMFSTSKGVYARCLEGVEVLASDAQGKGGYGPTHRLCLVDSQGDGTFTHLLEALPLAFRPPVPKWATP
ncbi:MAG: hypothetical protein J0L64_25495 [Acidobacteria bacterium]|nr:hypothetical protein [Acidobacteriota bacterium]